MRVSARWLGILALGCAAAGGIALAVAPATLSNEDGSTLTRPGQPVPPFSIITTDGQTLTPASLKGKVVLINFFATWGGPCVAEMPKLVKLRERFQDTPAFEMVAVGREHRPAEVKAFAAEHHVNFPVAADPGRSTYDLFARQYVPRNYVIDASGTIVYQSVGFSEQEFAEMTRAIEQALGPAASK
jgi:peroxiredoxin